MTRKVFVGDIGTEIICDAGSDISAQTTLKILYEKPDGTEGEWVASVYNTNFAKYTTIADDIDMEGKWSFRIYVELPSWLGYGEVDSIKVYPLAW